MLRLSRLVAGGKDEEAVRALYERAFPANERRPIGPLLRDRTGHAKVLAAREDDRFCGFVCTLEWDDMVHIIYFAVAETMRGRGIGSRILAEMRAANPGKRLLVDIERPDGSAGNNIQRLRRKSFYLRNGYEETEVRYVWREEDYVILSQGGKVTDSEFEQFWDALSKEMPGSEDY